MRTAISADGSTIAYRCVGEGPSVIIVHGGLETSESHLKLAEALSSQFSVYLIERRGRGTGNVVCPYCGMKTELSDVEAIVRDTRARLLFGVSSGALISLEVLRQNPDLFDKVAIFEPPLAINASRFEQMYLQFEKNYKTGDAASMLVLGMRMSEMGPRVLHFLPLWLLRPMVKRLSTAEAQKRKAGAAAEIPLLQNLAPTLLYDFQLVRGMICRPHSDFSALSKSNAQILMLSGTASRPYLIASCELLENAIVGARHTRLDGLDHLGTGNEKFGGKPKLVANVLGEFYDKGSQ